MREIFKSGSVGGAPGKRCFYLEVGSAFGQASLPSRLRLIRGDYILSQKILALSNHNSYNVLQQNTLEATYEQSYFHSDP
jgi:hypothetical protein